VVMKGYSYTSTPPMGRRPVQSLSACTRGEFKFTNSVCKCWQLQDVRGLGFLTLTDWLTNQLTPCSRITSEKLSGLQLFKKFPPLYWKRNYNIAFKFAHHLSLSWARAIQSTPHPNSCRTFLILFSHLRLGLRSVIFPSGLSHQKPVYTCTVSHTCHMPRQSHFSGFYHSNNIWGGVKIIKLLVMYSSPLSCYLFYLKGNFKLYPTVVCSYESVILQTFIQVDNLCKYLWFPI